jgi:hypothetical protein
MVANDARRLRTPASLMAMVVVGVSLLLAAGNVSADERASEALRAGSWSLQFGISSNFTLTSFEGVLISCKKHLSPKSAIRTGLTVSGQVGNVNGDSERSGVTLGNSKTDTDAASLSLSALYIYYPSPVRRLNVFSGLGPDIGLSRSKDETRNVSYSYRGEIISKSWTYRRQVYFGLRGVVGGEWFAASRVSVLADYVLNLRYSYQRTERWSGYEKLPDDAGPQDSDRNVSKTEWLSLSSGGVQFALSIYF